MTGRSILNSTLPADRFHEMLDAQGGVRLPWQPLLTHLDHLSPEALRARARSMREAIASDGVTYNVYDDPQGASRPWEVDMLPLILGADEWEPLANALAQRASLLNRVLADLYGPQTLIKEGLVPPALVYGQHGYLWPCQGIEPPGGIHLHCYAADLARSPDGQWWVLSDRTQGPSGSGYALQNRQIITQAMPDALRTLSTQPLWGYFRTLQETLTQLAPAHGETPLMVLLTPGPYNETYFEHVFLSRQLGFPLVEGTDLTVRGDKVYLKTLHGLRRVHAILRRLDDDYCDPLELRADSALGIPGLLQAVRAGNVLVANNLGSGILQSGALSAFLPAIQQHFDGQALDLPAVASWWCGEAPALEYVLDHLQDLVIKPAFPSMQMGPIFGHTLNTAERRYLSERITQNPHAYVAQEWVRLSEAPILPRAAERRLNLRGTAQDGLGLAQHFSHRPIVLRAFAVARADGSYAVMPGGLARVAAKRGGDVVSMQHGGTSKDVWVAGQSASWSASSPPPLAAPAALQSIAHDATEIPSRMGENLFWMGRYAERCESIARLLRAALRRNADAGSDSERAVLGLLDVAQNIDLLPEYASGEILPQAADEELLNAVHNPQLPSSLAANLQRLRGSATQVREFLSHDNWLALQRLHQAVPLHSNSASEALTALDKVMQGCAALSGFAYDDMTRDDGWRFLMIGRRIERLVHSCDVLCQFLRLSPTLREVSLDWLLEAANSTMTYRVRYRRAPELMQVLALLLSDMSNPHGVLHQFQALEQELAPLQREEGQDIWGSMETLHNVLDGLRDFNLRPLSYDPATRQITCKMLAQIFEDALHWIYVLSDTLGRQHFTHAGTALSQGG